MTTMPHPASLKARCDSGKLGFEDRQILTKKFGATRTRNYLINNISSIQSKKSCYYQQLFPFVTNLERFIIF
jgi:hypothetical protein